MRKLILFTLLLMFSTSTLSFAQDTPTPTKERNWIVGIGWTPPTAESTYPSTNTSTKHYNATVGYKGFTISYYHMPTKITYQGSSNYPSKVIYNQVREYITVGYQHVFSKKSNAKVKPIVGFEYGLSSYVFNTGIRYKRSQALMSVGTFSEYRDSSFPVLIPYYDDFWINRYVTIKYQFLF